jgi:hypothetical protein
MPATATQVTSVDGQYLENQCACCCQLGTVRGKHAHRGLLLPLKRLRLPQTEVPLRFGPDRGRMQSVMLYPLAVCIGLPVN